jgi:hypothetical protein
MVLLGAETAGRRLMFASAFQAYEKSGITFLTGLMLS